MRKNSNSKYYSKKVRIGDLTFDSQKEAERFQQLSLLQRTGKISNLQRQVPFVLIPAQYEEVTVYTPKTRKEKKVKKLVERKVKYVADFVYTNADGQIVVEDVKGYKKSTAYAEYAIKRKLMLFIHGLKVVEI